MKHETTFKNYQAYSRIIETMSLMDHVHELTLEDVRDAADGICELPDQPLEGVSMEEVLFWAGLATGMEVCKKFEEGHLDAETAEKFMTYSALFAYSTQNAVVDLTIQGLDPGT